MKIGVFGGCFNPPHKKHKTIALDLIKKGYIDKAIYVPTGNSYNKYELISFNHRVNMLKLITKGNKQIDILEIGNKENYQYTYQILDEIQKKYKNDEIYFICGEDNLEEFDTWKRYTYILKKYKILMIKRNNMNTDKILKKYDSFKNNIIVVNINSKNMSSTMIRKLIKEDNKKDILDFIDKEVYEYIIKENLYKEGIK